MISLFSLKFTWPEFQASDEVQMEEFWLAMESEALEQAVFPSNVSITRFDASIIAPFFPALMRSSMIINTEKDKITTNTEHTGGVVFKSVYLQLNMVTSLHQHQYHHIVYFFSLVHALELVPIVSIVNYIISVL